VHARWLTPGRSDTLRCMVAGPEHDLELRKARGAFFTPPAIADYLAHWAVGGNVDAKVLDPTCGEAVFLLAAGRRLRQLGCPPTDLDQHLYGVDLHATSLRTSQRLLAAEGMAAQLIAGDFFNIPAPSQLGCPFPEVDAVIGNPPFVRYQEHAGETRKASTQAALAQGVSLSGLASSWAALLVHACAFLKRDGRLTMVLPAELLTVNYAEPIRRWLRRRFAAVNLVMFERLQFADALEKVVLVVAWGFGGCDSFSVYHVADAEDLPNLGPFDHVNVTPVDGQKWTSLLLPVPQRQLYRSVANAHFVRLDSYGSPELGTVTGANRFFTLSEATRRAYGLEEAQVRPTSPPGTRHLRGLFFTTAEWEALREQDEAVWLLYPDPDDRSPQLQAYLATGVENGIDQAYKCRVRTPWWRPPMVSPPDLFFTYMSHRYPRLITNEARVTLLNSMHGVRLHSSSPTIARRALPLLALNSVTMLGAEVLGRSYGGGILKMEPREAAGLPVPAPRVMEVAWKRLKDDLPTLDRQLRDGSWASVVKRVDDVLLRQTLQLPIDDVAALHRATGQLRERRLGRKGAPVA
jgi:adenine-specific DNA-methyltransferase